MVRLFQDDPNSQPCMRARGIITLRTPKHAYSFVRSRLVDIVFWLSHHVRNGNKKTTGSGTIWLAATEEEEVEEEAYYACPGRGKS